MNVIGDWLSAQVPSETEKMAQDIREERVRILALVQDHEHRREEYVGIGSDDEDARPIDMRPSIAFESFRFRVHPLIGAGENIKGDRETILEALRIQGSLSRKWRLETFENRNAREDEAGFVICRPDKSRSEYVLQYASEGLRNDHQVVAAAMAFNGYSLEWASDELKNDRDIVLAAVRNDGEALGLASEELKHDRDFALACVKESASAFALLPESLRDDHALAELAVAQDGWALGHASKALQDSRDLVKTALALDGKCIQFASAELQSDPAVAMIAVAQYGKVALQASSVWSFVARGDAEELKSHESLYTWITEHLCDRSSFSAVLNGTIPNQQLYLVGRPECSLPLLQGHDIWKLVAKFLTDVLLCGSDLQHAQKAEERFHRKVLVEGLGYYVEENSIMHSMQEHRNKKMFNAKPPIVFRPKKTGDNSSVYDKKLALWVRTELRKNKDDGSATLESLWMVMTATRGNLWESQSSFEIAIKSLALSSSAGFVNGEGTVGLNVVEGVVVRY